MSDRDGFIIVNENNEELHFVPCTKNDSARIGVEMGILRRIAETTHRLVDTRWGDE